MKKLHYFIIFFFVFITLPIFSQGEANIWYFGQNAGLDFSTSPPTALTDGQINTDEGCSSFSDSNGNLLFYSDGISVYNKNHELMTYSNGSLANNLEGNPSSTQSGMIIPKPGSTSIYYLFTVGTNFTEDTANPGFNYYTIDMSLNSNLGEITEGPVNLAINPSTGLDASFLWSEKVTAVKGKECNTFWVLSFVTNTFYAYKVDENGVDITNVVTSVVNYTSIDKRGYLQVSPDGKKIAFADYNLISYRDDTPSLIRGSLVLFDFDDETGIVNATSEIIIPDGSEQSPYGVAFSQQSNKLYTSTYNDKDLTILQFDMNNSDIATSKTTIITKSNKYRSGLQLGPDGKIYISIPDSRYLDVIENPNHNAEDIIYSEEGIYLNGKSASEGLPPFVSSLLLPVEIYNTSSNDLINNEDLQKCIGESISLEPETISGTDITYSWTFDNDTTTTEVSTASSLELNNLSTLNNGTYNLTISLEDDCSNKTTYEATFNLEVFEPAAATKPNDINFCSIDGINSFDLQSDVTPQVIDIQDPNQFEVLYYKTQSDAINNSNPLVTPYDNITNFSSEIIYVRIHNIDAPNACFDITEFNLTNTEIPQPTQPENYITCDDTASGSDTDGIFNNFILSTKDDEILGNLDANQFNISYHTNLTGAQTSSSTDVINKNTAYTNTTANEQIIYVRIENVNNTDCAVVSEETSTTFKPFSLLVNPLPTINNYTQLTQCDTDTDLSTTANLTLAEVNISDNYHNETFKYYPTENDANNDTSEIIETTTYIVTNGDSVWVRIISDKDCYRISELNIIVSYNGTINYNETFTECDDETDGNGNDSDTDGIANFDLSSVTTDVLNFFPLSIQNELDVLIFETLQDRDALLNKIDDLENYRNTNIPAFNPQSLYFKVINKATNDCAGLGEFTINTNTLPYFEVTTPQTFCLSNSPLTIEAENINGTYSYAWTKNNETSIIGTNSNIDVTTEGEYNITTTNNTTLCERTKTITVITSDIATINDSNITIVDDSSNNSISIHEANLGVGDYEYALFNEDETDTIVDYQNEPLFENLKGGIYTIAIQDKNNCGIVTYQVSIIDFPDFFTPNGDTYNDTWTVKGINTTFYPTNTMYIFDRFGKKVAEISIDSDGWDGTLNGKPLPSNDYWYRVELTDTEGNTRNKKGHFSLIRN